MLKAVFFDAVGTLIYLPRTVGEHYRGVGVRFGVEMDAAALNRAFKKAWANAPARTSEGGARVDDDKGWWRALVSDVLGQVMSPEQARTLDKAAYFEAVYAHFALPGVWQAFDDVRPVLARLRAGGMRIGLISNFDRRLHTILEAMDLRHFFDVVIVSSEVGCDKPDPAIFQVALSEMAVAASEALHVGDDPKKDWGAEAAGLHVFRLERPGHSLYDLFSSLDSCYAESKNACI